MNSLCLTSGLHIWYLIHPNIPVRGDFFKDMIDQVELQVEELKGAGKEIPEDLQYT